MGIVSKIREALKRAQGDVDALQAKVGYWAQIVEAKRAELAELDASVGRQVADDETGKALENYGAARYGLDAQIEAARKTVEEFEGRLRGAQWTLMDAQAQQLREQAQAVRGEAELLQGKVDAAKAALDELAGGDWRPWQPDSQDVIQAGAAGITLSPLKTPPMFAEANRLDAQAQALEERVGAERRQAAVLVPNARLVWPGQHDHGHLVNLAVEAGVNDGLGSVTFEVVKNGLVLESFVLPQGGRRGVRRLVDGFHGDTVEVRAASQVLVSQTLEVPPGEVNDGRGRPLIAGHAS